MLHGGVQKRKRFPGENKISSGSLTVDSENLSCGVCTLSKCFPITVSVQHMNETTDQLGKCN